LKKVLFSVMSLMVVVGLVGGGAFAYFSDTETSTANTFTAGSLDLAMNPTAAGAIVTEPNTQPGQEYGPYSVSFENIGTLPGKVFVNLSIDQTNVDVDQTGQGTGEYRDAAYGGNGVNVSPDDYAKKLIVTQAYLDGTSTNVADWWAQQSINEGGLVATGEVVVNPASVTGFSPTIYGLSKITLHFANGIPPAADWQWDPGASHSEQFYLKLAEDADNDYQYDGISMTLKSTILQMNDDTTDPATLVLP
jgi:predicted ribosomally synthesized peptide with SipW-like signal peptide